MRRDFLARASALALGFCLIAGCGLHRGPHPDEKSGVTPTAGSVMSTSDRDALEAVAAARAAEAPTDGYRIGPDDLLDVRIPDLTEPQAMVGARPTSGQPVAGAPTFQQGLRVSAAGDINVQTLGLVRVAGLTPTAAEAELGRRLVAAGILRAPQVSVQVAEYRSGVVAVIGSVERPGLYPVTRPHATIADLLWAAGGPSKEAGRVVEFACTRMGVGDGGTQAGPPIRVDLEALLRPEARGTAPAAACRGQRCSAPTINSMNVPFNTEVRPGDVITVRAAGSVTVDGWVDKPGSYPITRGLTLGGVIAAAGGALFPADRSRTTVRRVTGSGEEVSFDVDLAAVSAGSATDVPIADGDVVHVPAAPERLVPWGVWTVAREMVHVGGSVLLF